MARPKMIARRPPSPHSIASRKAQAVTIKGEPDWWNADADVNGVAAEAEERAEAAREHDRSDAEAREAACVKVLMRAAKREKEDKVVQAAKEEEDEDAEARVEAALALQSARRDRGKREAMPQQAAKPVERPDMSFSSGRVADIWRRKKVASQDDSGPDQSEVEPPELVNETLHTNLYELVGESSRRVVPQRAEAEAPPARKRKQRAAPAAEDKFQCTACGIPVQVTNVWMHPILPVGICHKCHDFLFESPFTKDIAPDGSYDEHENQCRWCGDGGQIVLCDTCDKVFCKSCITRSFGVAGLKAIEESENQWSCYFCDETPLLPLKHEYESIKHLTKTTKRRKRQYKPRGGRSNAAARPEETVAAAIARQQEDMQRRLKSTGREQFGGFKVKKPRGRPSQRQGNWTRDRLENGVSASDFTPMRLWPNFERL